MANPRPGLLVLSISLLVLPRVALDMVLATGS